MSRRLSLEENIQIRLPVGTKARMREHLQHIPVATFWRAKMLDWLNIEDLAREARGDGE